ncbi:MAG: GH3 auxin-responsive promoter family protein [Flavobacteriales bacterium]
MPFNSILSWLTKRRVKQIELFKKYPNEVQHDVFRYLINSARNTEWGQQYDYKSIESYKQFSDRLPIQDYDDVKPYVERLIKGEQNLLWCTPIKWFAKSSGTTSGKSKFIPVSREALEDCHYKGGKDLLGLYYYHFPEAKLYKGKNLVIGGSAQINSLNKHSYLGDLSAIILKNLPLWVELKRTPNIEIALMDKWEEKIEKMADAIIQEDVRSMSGVPSWGLVLLRRILEKIRKDNIADIWPNLELFMHGGVNFEPYRKQYENIIRKTNMNYLETYNASEGFFGLQEGNFSNLLLMLDYGIFYEFISQDELGKTNPKTVPLAGVELGKNYAIVISTNAGLWRYMVGDTIMFTSIYPYRFKITGRTKHFINAFGEEIIIDNADKAIHSACEKTNSSIKEYTAGPIYMDNDKGGHQWLIEFEKEPENLEIFTRLLDDELKSLNSDYEAKRTGDLTISLPKVTSVPCGTFYDWLKQKGKLGGQHKVPRLSNNRIVLEEIFKILDNK